MVSIGFAFFLAGLGYGEEAPWKLLYEERFTKKVSSEKMPWRPDPGGRRSPYEAGFFDDDGIFFKNNGGKEFQRQLETFRIFRKRLVFGDEGWLTVELAARGPAGASKPESPPRFDSGDIEVPGHHGGVLLRSTRPLPERYRVEVEFSRIEFGGAGSKGNGYSGDGPKTNHPWSWGPGPELKKGYESWSNVRGSNGFYYLTIVDHANAAPRNNIFIHTRRKAAIDSYHVPGAPKEICDPKTGRPAPGIGRALNMFFLVPGTALESKIEMANACDGQGLPAAEMRRGEPYRFAIERRSNGYILEAAGSFERSGRRILRYARPFVKDGVPIWHFNRPGTPYNGVFNRKRSLEGPFGYFSFDDWPRGKGYPDFFILGDPHLTHYEGSATVKRIALFIPRQNP